MARRVNKDRGKRPAGWRVGTPVFDFSERDAQMASDPDNDRVPVSPSKAPDDQVQEVA